MIPPDIVRKFFWFGLVWFGFFQDRVSLCSLGCPGTHSVDQAGLELRDLPASLNIFLNDSFLVFYALLLCLILKEYFACFETI